MWLTLKSSCCYCACLSISLSVCLWLFLAHSFSFLVSPSLCPYGTINKHAFSFHFIIACCRFFTHYNGRVLREWLELVGFPECLDTNLNWTCKSQCALHSTCVATLVSSFPLCSDGLQPDSLFLGKSANGLHQTPLRLQTLQAQGRHAASTHHHW